MKKSVALMLILCMLLPSVLFVQAEKADKTYIYLRPENFAPGSWTPMENEAGALDGLNLKGKVDRMIKDAVPASAQIEIKQDGTYYLWTRAMDHETVPGTRNFKAALGDKLMPTKLATHGTNGYVWELAGKTDLTAGNHFVKLVDTSCYYARCDAVLVTDDADFVPPATEDALKKALKTYQAPKSSAVADTTVPTAQGEVAEPPAGYEKPGTVEKEPAKIAADEKQTVVTVDSAQFFTHDIWGDVFRGNILGKYRSSNPGSAIWHPNITSAGKVKISFYAILDTVNKTQNDSMATYEVYYGNDEVEIFTFNMDKMEKEGWVEIGTFDFTGNGKEFVRFNKMSGNGVDEMTRISEIKFEAVGGKLTYGKELPKEPEVPNVKRAAEVTICAFDAGYTEVGPWRKSAGTGADGKDASTVACENAYAAFVPGIAEAKDLKVEFYHNPAQELSMPMDKNAKITVVHSGKTDEIPFDMTQPAGWYEIGTFGFAGTGNEYVMVKKCSDITTNVRAAAVRFTADGSFKVSMDDAKLPDSVVFTPTAAPAGKLYDENAVADFKLQNAFFNPSQAKIIAHGDPEYSEVGTWYSSGLAGYFNPVISNNTASRYSFDPKASATWGTGGMVGNVEVSVYRLVHQNSDSQAKFTVKHNGKTETFYLDFTKGTPDWVTLGVFDFAGTPDEGVTLDNHETAYTCRANAVKYEQCFVPVQSADGITTATVDTPYFDGIPAEAAKQVVNAETVPALKLDYQYVNKGITVTYNGDKVNIAKRDFPNGNLALDTNIGYLAVPLSELNLADSDKLVLEIKKSDKTVDGAVSDVIDFTVSVNGVALVTQYAPIEITVYGNVSDKQTTALKKIGDTTQYVPAFIEQYGAFGEIHGPYTGSTFAEKEAVFNNNIFAMADISAGGTFAITKSNVIMPDMEGHWAKADVNLMASKGLVSGKGNGYDPEANITRAEFCTLLLRAVGFGLSDVPCGYTDVEATEWYAPYISGAKQAGIFEGLPYTTEFEPNKPISRQEMAVMIVNGVKAAGKFKNTLIEANYYLNNFADKDSIAPWGKEGVARAVELGIIMGIEKEGQMTFSPDENATRAQAAVMLKRFLDVDAYVGPLADGKWELTFHDEFDGDDLNDDVWDSVNGPHSHINSSRYRENVEVHDGKAYLITKDEDKGGKNWTSASIWTKEFDQTYGYFEAKYKYPDSESMNYNIAFWLYKSMITVNDTKYYEIDINEGRMPGTIQTAEHFSGDNQANRGSKYDYQWMTDDYRYGYHIFAIEWTPTEMVWYVDGREIRRRATTYSNHPMQVYLSTAIMHDATEEELLKDANGTAMEVEYVRVYQRTN